jgi:putative DNA primase/helicase
MQSDTPIGVQPPVATSCPTAIVSDARLSGRTDIATVTERLQSISGEDALTVDRKQLPPVTPKLSARFMILTNELPKMGDSSGALAGRGAVVAFPEGGTFPGSFSVPPTPPVRRDFPLPQPGP